MAAKKKEVSRKKQSKSKQAKEFETEIKNLELMNFMTPGQRFITRVKASGLDSW